MERELTKQEQEKVVAEVETFLKSARRSDGAHLLVNRENGIKLLTFIASFEDKIVSQQTLENARQALDKSLQWEDLAAKRRQKTVRLQEKDRQGRRAVVNGRINHAVIQSEQPDAPESKTSLTGLVNHATMNSDENVKFVTDVTHLAAQKQAKQKIDEFFKNSNPSVQKFISEILTRHKSLGVSPVGTLTEISSYMQLQSWLQSPPRGHNGNHVDAVSTRISIGTIIQAEVAASESDTALAGSLWFRTVKRVQDEVMSKFDRGIR
jgi:hypothetical protein